MEEFKYTIGEKQYVQKPLVLGQVSQLLKIFQEVGFRATFSPREIVALLGDRFSAALAVVLIPDGMSVAKKDLAAIEQDLAFAADIDTALKVVEDFFICNQVSSLFTRLEDLAKKVAPVPAKTPAEDGTLTR